VTASFVAGALLGFPLPENVGFYSLAAMTVLLVVSLAVSQKRKGKLKTSKTEKADKEREIEEIREKLQKAEAALDKNIADQRLDDETTVKFMTLVSKLLRVSPADAYTLLRRTIRFFSEEPESEGTQNAVFSTETLITEAFAAAFSETEDSGVHIIINIPESFPAKLSGAEREIRNILTQTAEAAISLPPRSLEIDVDFITKGEGYDIRFIFEATGIPLSKSETDILTGAVSRGGVGGKLHFAKSKTEAIGGKFDIKPRGGNTLFTVIFPALKTAGGVIGKRAAKDIHSLLFLDCDFEYIPYGRVLICDKNPRRRMAFSDLLMLHGLKTYTAADAAAAAGLIRSGENFGVIFLDFDTEDNTKILSDSGYDGIVIAVTASELPQSVISENGFGGQIRKPADPRVVESILNQFIISRQPPAVIAAASYSKKKTVLTGAKVLPESTANRTDEPTPEETLKALENLGENLGENAEPVYESPEFAPESAGLTAETAAAKPEVSAPQSAGPSPKITKTAVTKAEFIALSDEIFIKLYETMETDLAAFSEHAKTIKTACADIGNSDLTAKARALEFAAKDGKRAFISEFTPDFLTELRNFAESLSDTPKKNDAFLSAAVKTLAEPIPAAGTPPVYQKKPQKELGEEIPVATVLKAAPPASTAAEMPQPANEQSAPQNVSPIAPGLAQQNTSQIAQQNSNPQSAPQKIAPTVEEIASKSLETVIAALGDFDSPRALEAVEMIDADKLNVMAHGLIEEIKSLIAIGELAEAAEMAQNLLEDFE
jgi:CheY-like chemotaxis protein